ALIIQLIRVFDDIWKKNGLDLRMTPYTVLPTSQEGGFLEYVDSISVAQIVSKYGTIQNYLNSSEGKGVSHATKIENFRKKL
ncbi:Uncharacterized protein FKW44_013707, partial [Caligus rogercresseyi]